jgi:hypothetical protein
MLMLKQIKKSSENDFVSIFCTRDSSCQKIFEFFGEILMLC